MNRSVANSMMIRAAANIVGYEFLDARSFASKRATLTWAGHQAQYGGSEYGRVYMIVTDRVVKIGSSSAIGQRMEAHLGRKASYGPLNFYPFVSVIVSGVSEDFRSLESQLHRLCQSVGVPRYGAVASPHGREFYNSGHPLFECVSRLLMGELHWPELIELITGNSKASHQWRANVLNNASAWFSLTGPTSRVATFPQPNCRNHQEASA